MLSGVCLALLQLLVHATAAVWVLPCPCFPPLPLSGSGGQAAPSKASDFLARTTLLTYAGGGVSGVVAEEGATFLARTCVRTP